MTAHLPDALAAVMLISLVIYALLGGADFGGGVWDLLASGPRKEAQRALIENAIAPVWEANHVWLILVVVVLFSAFPTAFSALTIALHVPFIGVLIGIVLRGAAFVFRQYGGAARALPLPADGPRASRATKAPDAAGARRSDPGERRWGRVFAVASTITPVLLGMAVGAIASGAVHLDNNGLPIGGWFRPWLGWFEFACGAFGLSLFAFLAAIYLAAEALPYARSARAARGDRAEGDAALQKDFRLRALISGVIVFLCALLCALAAPDTTAVRHAIVELGRWWSWPLHALTAISAIGAFVAILRRRYRLARVLAAAQVTLILLGWGVAQYPYLIPPDITVASAAAPPAALRAVAWAVAAGAFIILPSLYAMLRVFKLRRMPDD